jgi:hypothetical protein
MSADLALRYYRALADLPHDRQAALAELESCFGDAETPGRLEGPTRGRLITTTYGYGLDAITGAIARAWMPWTGKVFDPEAKDGRNLFTPSFRPILRILWPGYDLDRDEGPRRFSAFPFTTWHGASAYPPGGREVLKIDYEHPQSPWLVRDILDELVRIDETVYLGQALLRFRGRLRRVAWFDLRPAV